MSLLDLYKIIQLTSAMAITFVIWAIIGKFATEYIINVRAANWSILKFKLPPLTVKALDIPEMDRKVSIATGTVTLTISLQDRKITHSYSTLLVSSAVKMFDEEWAKLETAFYDQNSDLITELNKPTQQGDI